MGAARGTAAVGATPPVIPGEPTVDIMADDYMQRLRDDRPVASTGLPGLDAVLGGGLRRRLLLLGGPPGCGKTTLCHQIADHIAAQGVPVLYFSLETTPQSLYAASIARASEGRLTRGDIMDHAEEVEGDPAFATARDSYLGSSGGRLAIVEGYRSADDVVEALSAARAAGSAVPVAFVDYLQIMSWGGYGEAGDERQKVKHSISVLHDAVSRLGTPIVCLSSVSRDKYSDPTVIGALEGSSALEYGAEILAILDTAGERPADRRRNAFKPLRPMQLTIIKNRNGNVDRISLVYITGQARFVEN